MNKGLVVLAVLGGLMLTGFVSGTAYAQQTVTHDPQGDGVKTSDVQKVTVRHREKRVRLKTRVYDGDHVSHEVWHLVDTTGDARPDFLVFVVVKNEVGPNPYVEISRIGAWPRFANPYELLSSGTRVSCGLHKGRVRDGRKLLSVLIGRGCLKTDGELPQRLRVNTFGTWDWGQITDVAPKWRRYGAWVTSA